MKEVRSLNKYLSFFRKCLKNSKGTRNSLERLLNSFRDIPKNMFFRPRSRSVTRPPFTTHNLSTHPLILVSDTPLTPEKPVLWLHTGSTDPTNLLLNLFFVLFFFMGRFQNLARLKKMLITHY